MDTPEETISKIENLRLVIELKMKIEKRKTLLTVLKEETKEKPRTLILGTTLKVRTRSSIQYSMAGPAGPTSQTNLTNMSGVSSPRTWAQVNLVIPQPGTLADHRTKSRGNTLRQTSAAVTRVRSPVRPATPILPLEGDMLEEEEEEEVVVVIKTSVSGTAREM